MIFLTILVLILLKCLKSFLNALSDVLESIFEEPRPPNVGCPAHLTSHPPPHGLRAIYHQRARIGTLPRQGQDDENCPPNLNFPATRDPLARRTELASHNLNIPDNPPNYDQINPEPVDVTPPPRPGLLEAPPAYDTLYPRDEVESQPNGIESDVPSPPRQQHSTSETEPSTTLEVVDESGPKDGNNS